MICDKDVVLEDYATSLSSYTEFRNYLQKFLNGTVERDFHVYNKLSRGPKAISIESPKPPSNPHSLIEYYDPIVHEPAINNSKDHVRKEMDELKIEIDSLIGIDKLYTFNSTDEIDWDKNDFDNRIMRDEDFENIIKLELDDYLSKDIFTFDGEDFWQSHREVLEPFITNEYAFSNVSLDLTNDDETICTRNSPIDIHLIDRYINCNENDFNTDHQASTSRISYERIRKSEVNDLQPNPKKFLEIGFRIHKLAEQCNINSPQSSFESTPEISTKKRLKNKRKMNTLEVRRLKSQLGSRICRLKKRASLEANKIFFDAIQKEQKNLLFVIRTMNEMLLNKTGNDKLSTSSQCSKLNSLIKQNLDEMAAGYKDRCIRKLLSTTAEGILNNNDEMNSYCFEDLFD